MLNILILIPLIAINHYIYSSTWATFWVDGGYNELVNGVDDG